MLHIKSILFPTDRSETAERALSHAAFLAKKHNAVLHIIHVLTDTLSTAPTEDDLIPQQLKDQLDAPEVKVNIINDSSPSGGILTYADENAIDLIVMGTLGRRGAQRMLTGTVAERVVREAPCPVLTIRKRSPQAVNHILVPVDFSERSKSAIPVAEALAQIYDADVTLFFVIDEDSVPMAHVPLLGPVRVSRDVIIERFKKLMEEIVEENQSDRVEVMGEVIIGQPAKDILERAEQDIDMIVISTHGRTGFERIFLGSVAEKIVRRAPGAVFTTKSFGAPLVGDN